MTEAEWALGRRDPWQLNVTRVGHVDDDTTCINCGHTLYFHDDPASCLGDLTGGDGPCECCWFTEAPS